MYKVCLNPLHRSSFRGWKDRVDWQNCCFSFKSFLTIYSSEPNSFSLWTAEEGKILSFNQYCTLFLCRCSLNFCTSAKGHLQFLQVGRLHRFRLAASSRRTIPQHWVLFLVWVRLLCQSCRRLLLILWFVFCAIIDHKTKAVQASWWGSWFLSDWRFIFFWKFFFHK